MSHRYPVKLDIPQQLAQLKNRIFESLPRTESVRWGERFLSAIRPGSDLSLVWPRFALWLLTADDSPMVLGARNESVREVVKTVAALYQEWVDTGERPSAERFDAPQVLPEAGAREASWASASAVWAAASAAWVSAAAWAGAGDAAWASAKAASVAEIAAWTSAWKGMAEKLIQLLSQA